MEEKKMGDKKGSCGFENTILGNKDPDFSWFRKYEFRKIRFNRDKIQVII